MLHGFLFSSNVETQQLGLSLIEYDQFSDLKYFLNSLNSYKTREGVFCHLS